MIYALAAVVVVVLVLLGVFLVIRLRKPADEAIVEEAPAPLPPAVQLAKLQHAGKFWGVSVESHCHASSQLAGQQFPFEEAPELPLPDCDAEVCHCRFVGLPERRFLPTRRSGKDRRESLRMDAEERRSDQARRKSERGAWEAFRHERL